MQGRKVSTRTAQYGVANLAPTRPTRGDRTGRYVALLRIPEYSFMRKSTDVAESLVRCSPGEDATNGFFVSLFVRESQVAENSDRSNVTKRKHSDETTLKDNDGHQQKRRKRKKAATKST